MARLATPTNTGEIATDEPSALDDMDLPDVLERIDRTIRWIP